MSYKTTKEFVRKYYKYKGEVPSNIPATYKCLKSITGGRFDSNIQMTHNTSIECESALVVNDTNWQYLIDNDSSSGSWFIIGKEQTTGPFTCHFLSNFWSLGISPTVNQFYHFFIDMSATTKLFYIDNNLQLKPSDSSTGNLGNTLNLNHSRYKSKYFKTYNSNMELEHYIVPVKRIADSKLGWYDTITEVFHSDSFLEPITAYEELEYEKGTSSDYDFYEDVYVGKAVKGTEETIVSWVQPAVTSATSNGIITASTPYYNGYAWQAADGVIDLNNDTTGFLTTASDAFWQWQLPEVIYASNVKLWKDAAHLANHRLYIKLYKDNTLVYTSNEVTWGTVSNIDIPLSDEIGFDTIRIEWTYSSDRYSRKFLQELQITANTLSSISTYKVVQKADPTPTNIGDAYEEVYSGSGTSFSSYTLMTTNTPQSVSRMRLWDSGDNGLDNVWDGTSDLVIEQDFTYNGFTVNFNPMLLTKTVSDASLSGSLIIDINGLGIAVADRPRYSLISGHSYTIRLTMNYNTRYITLEVKDNTAGTSFVQVDNYLGSTYQGVVSRIIICNCGYNSFTSSYVHTIDLDLSNTKVTANGTIIFQRS